MLFCCLLFFEIFFQDYHQSVGPDLCPAYLQMLSTDNPFSSRMLNQMKNGVLVCLNGPFLKLLLNYVSDILSFDKLTAQL